MVGGEALRLCVDNPEIASVVSVGRRPSGIEHARLKEIQHANFKDYSALRSHIEKADFVLWCIGVYTGSVSEDKFFEITCGYLEPLVQAIEEVNPTLTFCLFSASGADPSEQSRMVFARAKGRAERMLQASKIKDHYIFRPGYIYPNSGNGPASFMYRISPFFYRLFPGIGIDAIDLARVMIEAGINGLPERLYENSHMRALSVDLQPVS